MSSAPIGIFDSGVGGLTVIPKLLERSPGEKIVYFGDTARVPYGPRSKETIRKYAADDTEVLLSQKPKLIIVACNTVSAVALDVVQEKAGPIPVLGVLEPGARAAALTTRNRRVGVIGTTGTISSGAYDGKIKSLLSRVEVFSQACPLFVPLAEEGWLNHPATQLIAKDYLAPLKNAKVDTLVLGCTHYPLLKAILAEEMGPDVAIIDSSETIAVEVADLLTKKKIKSQSHVEEEPRILVSDLPLRFQAVAEHFLGRKIPEPTLIPTI